MFRLCDGYPREEMRIEQDIAMPLKADERIAGIHETIIAAAAHEARDYRFEQLAVISGGNGNKEDVMTYIFRMPGKKRKDSPEDIAMIVTTHKPVSEAVSGQYDIGPHVHFDVRDRRLVFLYKRLQTIASGRNLYKPGIL